MATDLADVPAELRGAAQAALAAAGVGDGHLAVELVDAARIRELNREHRGRDAPTDVLAFPLDGAGPTAGPRELGDVAICPEHCEDVTEAAVHGVLHLCGYDHETDQGEMLSAQAEIMKGIRRSPGMPGREAEDMPVDEKAQPSSGPGHDLTHPGPGEGRAGEVGIP
ncbi:MAG: rRNA maturation RNase YbeY [Solirubrobacterales bacterium]